jgi:hypothetical protein
MWLRIRSGCRSTSNNPTSLKEHVGSTKRRTKSCSCLIQLSGSMSPGGDVDRADPNMQETAEWSIDPTLWSIDPCSSNKNHRNRCLRSTGNPASYLTGQGSVMPKPEPRKPKPEALAPDVMDAAQGMASNSFLACQLQSSEFPVCRAASSWHYDRP